MKDLELKNSFLEVYSSPVSNSYLGKITKESVPSTTIGERSLAVKCVWSAESLSRCQKPSAYCSIALSKPTLLCAVWESSYLRANTLVIRVCQYFLYPSGFWCFGLNGTIILPSGWVLFL